MVSHTFKLVILGGKLTSVKKIIAGGQTTVGSILWVHTPYPTSIFGYSAIISVVLKNRGSKLGVQNESPYLGSKSRSQIGLLNPGPKSGSQIGVPKWSPKMGSQIGVPNWESIMGVIIGVDIGGTSIFGYSAIKSVVL
jgi:hypothetical protein